MLLTKNKERDGGNDMARDQVVKKAMLVGCE